MSSVAYAKDVFIANRWILRGAGLWPPDHPSKFIQIPFRVYTLVVFLFANLYFTSTEFLALFYTYKNLGAFIKVINFFLTHFMGAVKVIFWFFKGRVLRRLMTTLESEEFHYDSCEGFDPSEIWAQYRSTGFKYTLGFLLLAHIALASSYVPPLITVCFNPPPYGNGSVSPFYQRLPYRSWMPFSHSTPKTYLLAMGYQAGPMYSYAYSIVGMDSLFMNIMNFIAAHFSILQGALRTAAKRVTDALAENGGSVSDQAEMQKAMDKEMKKNSRHLQTILR